MTHLFPERDATDPVHLYACRLIGVMGALFVLAFGLLYHAAGPPVAWRDPLAGRLAVAALCVLPAGFSYRSRWVEARMGPLTVLLLYGLTVWFAVLTALNGFAATYGAGMIFLVAATGIALHMVDRRPVVLWPYVACCGVLAMGFVAWPGGSLSPWVFGGCMLATALVLVVAARLHEQERRAAQARIEEVQRLKHAFLGNVSHELRTPLALMLGYAEMMLADARPEDATFLQVILDNGKRLNAAINTLLELAQLESNRAETRPEQVDVAVLAGEVAAVHRAQAGAKGLTIELVRGTGDTSAVLDRLYLLRVLDGLVNNAVKFTEQGGVTVEVAGDDRQVCVRVCDTGIGIDAAFLPRIFETFEQESSGLTRRYGGIGVGLSIVRQLVQHLGGTIRVESRKGEGSTFTLTLPRGRHGR